MDVYLSTVSEPAQRRHEATRDHRHDLHAVDIKLFVGQNFAWMVEHAGGVGHFLVLGIGLELMTLTLVLVYFPPHRAGSVGEPRAGDALRVGRQQVLARRSGMQRASEHFTVSGM